MIGRGGHAAREAMFVLSFAGGVTLMSWDGNTDLDLAQRSELGQSGVTVIDEPVVSVHLLGGKMHLGSSHGNFVFDAVYPAMGANVASGIERDLGARLNEDGHIQVDEYQRTGVAGLYAVGGVVAGLNQISRATGEAATAVTALRNNLFGGVPFVRSRLPV